MATTTDASILSNNTDKVHNTHNTSNEVFKEISRQNQDGVKQSQRSQENQKSNEKLTHAGLLADFAITGTDAQASQPPSAQSKSWFERAESVVGEVAKGAVDEIINHPGRVLENVAIGAVVGVGATLLAPEAAIAAGVAGLGYAGYQLATHVGGWANDAGVVANPEQHSQAEVDQAKKDLQGVGAGTVDIAAGVAGGVAGGYLGSAIKSSLASRAAAEVEGDEVPKTTGDSTANPSPEEAAAKAAAAKELQVNESIARNQGLFDNAKAGDGVMTTQKQDYNVMFKKVLEPGKIPSLENPAGEAVTPGQWVATRLNPDGSPNIERGMVNQWPITEKSILKTYKLTPEQLSSSNELIGGTKTDGPPVHMIRLLKDLKISTSWGDMTGGKDDWLANYDFDPKTGTAGKDYAIITDKSWNQTYQEVKPE